MTRRRFVTVLTTMAIAAATILTISPPAVAEPAAAAAAVGCRAESCTGKSPYTQGCGATARTIDEFTYAGVRFELRYSPACRAAWTRVTAPRHSNTLFGQIRGGGHVYGVQAKIDRDGNQHSTRMIGTNHRVRTCRAVWFNARPNECTPFH